MFQEPGTLAFIFFTLKSVPNFYTNGELLSYIKNYKYHIELN